MERIGHADCPSPNPPCWREMPRPSQRFHRQQSRHLTREQQRLLCLRNQLQDALMQLKTSEEMLERRRREVGESKCACDECDGADSLQRKSQRQNGLGNAYRWENARSYTGAQQTQSPSLPPETSTVWTAEVSEQDSEPLLTLAPIGSTDRASSSSPSSSSESDQEASGSLFAGTSLATIVLLTALPAAIVIGVFFLRKHRR